MNSFWTSAANEVANVWHAAQANPFHAFCMTACAILGGGGLIMVAKDQLRLHRISKENQKRIDALPHPPKVDWRKLEADRLSK